MRHQYLSGGQPYPPPISHMAHRLASPLLCIQAMCTYLCCVVVNQVLRLVGAGPASLLLDRSRLVRAVKAVRNVGSLPASWLSEKSRSLHQPRASAMPGRD